MRWGISGRGAGEEEVIREKARKGRRSIATKNLEGKDQATALVNNPLLGVLCSVLPCSNSVNPGHCVSI